MSGTTKLKFLSLSLSLFLSFYKINKLKRRHRGLFWACVWTLAEQGRKSGTERAFVQFLKSAAGQFVESCMRSQCGTRRGGPSPGCSRFFPTTHCGPLLTYKTRSPCRRVCWAGGDTRDKHWAGFSKCENGKVCYSPSGSVDGDQHVYFNPRSLKQYLGVWFSKFPSRGRD